MDTTSMKDNSSLNIILDELHQLNDKGHHILMTIQGSKKGLEEIKKLGVQEDSNATNANPKIKAGANNQYPIFLEKCITSTTILELISLSKILVFMLSTFYYVSLGYGRQGLAHIYHCLDARRQGLANNKTIHVYFGWDIHRFSKQSTIHNIFCHVMHNLSRQHKC